MENEDFFEQDFFVDLKLTASFRDYLFKEKQKIKTIIKGGKVLDVGCGTGRSAAILASVADSVIAIDKSHRMVTVAKNRRKHKNITFIQEDILTSHFSNQFDYITFLWNTFGNLYLNRDIILSKIKDLINSDGLVLISVLSEEAFLFYIELLNKNNLHYTKYDENYVFLEKGLVSERFSEKKLENIFKNHNLYFKVEKLTKIAYWCEIRKEVSKYVGRRI